MSISMAELCKMQSFVSKEEQELYESLHTKLQQQHLFSEWAPAGTDEDKKHAMMQQLLTLDRECPGGLTDYVERARRLLLASGRGDNPFEEWIPELPAVEQTSAAAAGDFVRDHLEPLSPQFMELESLGLTEIGSVAFILVAGGLGERLGYNGIKVALPVETLTGGSYLAHYCAQILAVQRRYTNANPSADASASSGYLVYRAEGRTELMLPLVIMVSDDTHDKTIALLEEHGYFGLRKQQVSIIKQGKVPSLLDNAARIATSGPYSVDSKPHGHGDVHTLLHASGLPQSWHRDHRHVKHCLFFQDTNALGLLAVPIMLGNSIRASLDMNSMATPRAAKQAVGALITLRHASDRARTMTVNVEYNLLDPLLRATVAPEGDYNSPSTGRSPFPGNINMLLLRLSSYVEVLRASEGRMDEFVNPKYADNSNRERFKKPTRLECMMQDIAKLYCRGVGRESCGTKGGYKVGYTLAPAWFAYNPCKNNASDAIAMVAAGVPAAAPLLAESQQYAAYAELLRRLGVRIPSTLHAKEDVPEYSFLGLSAPLSPRVVVSPHVALFVSELQKLFPSPEKVTISVGSSLVLRSAARAAGETCGSPCITVQQLDLDGSLEVHVVAEGARLVIGGSGGEEAPLTVHNEGHAVVACDGGLPTPPTRDGTTNQLPATTLCHSLEPAMYAMRGYALEARGVHTVEVPSKDMGKGTGTATYRLCASGLVREK